MTPNEKTRPLGAAGLGDCHRRLASENRVYPTKSALNQAENTVVDAAHHRPQARRHPLLTVQIGVRAANQPHGRSRPFFLTHDALDELIGAACRLEARL
jgi:hypothetical protein